MKRNKFLLLALFLLISQLQINAQFNVGILGGINMANLSADRETTRLWTWGAGVATEYYLSDNIAIRTDPMFINKGGVLEGTLNNPRITLEFSVYELPILFKYDLDEPENAYIIAGPSFGYSSTVEMGAEINNRIFKADIKDHTERLDISAVLGVGINIPFVIGKMFLEIKYTHGFTNIPKNGSFTAEWNGVEINGNWDEKEDKFSTFGFQFMLGYLVEL